MHFDQLWFFYNGFHTTKHFQSLEWVIVLRKTERRNTICRGGGADGDTPWVKGVEADKGLEIYKNRVTHLKTVLGMAANSLTSELWPFLVLDTIILGMDAFITLFPNDQCVSQWSSLGTQSQEPISPSVK